MRLPRVAVQVAALVLAAGAAGVVSASGPSRALLCPAVRDCISTGALCVLVQIPRSESRKVTASEAFGDMEHQIANLQRRRQNVRYVVVDGDVADALTGIRKSARMRTVFVGKAGRALVSPGLFVDDPAPVEEFFNRGAMPEVLRGYMTAATVAERETFCDSRR